MQLSRREFIRLTGLVAAGATVAACSPVYRQLAGEPQAIQTWPGSIVNQDFMALNRLTFGPRVEERAAAAQIGLKAWIEEQLSPGGIQDTAAAWHVRKFDALTLSADALISWEKRDVIEQLKQATLLRQVYSKRQLYEVMVEFWSDHFNITVAKSFCWLLKVVDDREVIRKHALGNFRDLLWASAHSPAMMVYLDNHANHKDSPNENYARELMELHTLGVDGGYSQDDVMELARCLTGWTVKEHFWMGEFTFDADMHDTKPKTVLGHYIAPNGQGEAEQVLDMLATNPATARFVATKLVRRFITDDPERDAPELVDKDADTFLATDGDIKSVLGTILYDGLAGNQQYLTPKFKRPVHFIASTLRLLNADTNVSRAVFDPLGFMGQPTFEWPTPDGPPDTSLAWSSNLLPRWRFALGLMLGEIGGTSVNFAQLLKNAGAATPAELIDALSMLLIGAPFPAVERDQLAQTLTAGHASSDAELTSIVAAGLVASPAFQWR